MEHVLKFDEFTKNKCGGEKKFSMCIKVHGELVEKKMGVVNCSWCVKEKKCVEKETHEKKWKKRKVKRKKNTKQRMCIVWRK